MSKLHNMRAIEIPKFRAVSSGAKTLGQLFGEEDSFLSWVNSHRHLFKTHIYEPQDFLWHEDNDIDKSVWALAINDDVSKADIAPYEIIEFPGGMYLVATGDEKDSSDLEETIGGMMAWINDSDVFEYGDFPKSGMCNMPNADGAIDKAMGIAQQQIYLPLKFRAK